MTNIAVANVHHHRLKKGVFIGEAHGSTKYECINSHCWVISADGQSVLLQQRSESEQFFGGMLDISFAGHVDEGEDYRHAIIREAREEGGLNIEPYLPKKAKKIYFWEKGVFASHCFRHNQQAYVFYVVLKPALINQIKADNKEVGGFKLVSIEDFIMMTKDKNSRLVKHPRSYYSEVIKDITAIAQAVKLTK